MEQKEVASAATQFSDEHWVNLISRLTAWLRDHGIDETKARIRVNPPNNERKHAILFLSLPGDDGFDVFYGDTPQELFAQAVKRCESRVPQTVDKTALEALFKEWELLQVQMSKVRHCFDVLLKAQQWP